MIVWEETAVYYSTNKGEWLTGTQCMITCTHAFGTLGVAVILVPVYTVSNTVLSPVSWELDHIKQVSLGKSMIL